MLRRTFVGLSLALALGVVALNLGDTADAQSGSANRTTKHLVYTDDNGLAINGYDPVAYFTQGRPVAGVAAHTLTWRGATWRFANAENLAAFQQNPAKYAPAYGGFCAWGVAAQNDTFPIDPNAWKIVDGTLYLNYNADVQQKWLADIPGFLRTGDANWPGLERSRGK